MSRSVILLKSSPHDATDAYVEHFSSEGYTPYFINVLESVSVNDQKLEDIVGKGPTSYAGVAVTSSRAAEAWIKAIQNAESLGNWTQTPFYVVGEATASVLNRSVTSHPTNFSASLILGASHSGKSESLARFILADLPSRGSNGGRLLYLTGDKNRDTFQRMMNEGGVEVENLRVYQTQMTGDLREQIECVACEIEKAEEEQKLLWIVFFAPSSSDFALPHLHQYFHLGITPSLNSNYDVQTTVKLAAIGPTTADFLTTERHFRLDAVALKPTAEQLVASICDSDAKDAREEP